MYERGEREPGLETLEAIADYFNVDMDYLLGKSEHRNKAAWLDQIGASNESTSSCIQEEISDISPLAAKRTTGNRIRELRKAKNMTLKDLGKILGVAESTVSQYETGKRQPDNETLLKLGEFFGVPVGYLLGSEIEKAPSSDGSRLISDDDIKFALWGTQEIDDEVLDQVKAFAKFARENTKNRKSD